LRVLEIEEIKSVPSAPVSHPFVERLIGTIRREYFDRVFFLERRGFGAQAARIQNVLQLASSPSFARRLDPRATRRRILSCCSLA
jgi:hypothetical protein